MSFITYCKPGTNEFLHVQGENLVASDGTSFPIVNTIPRFVSIENYANSFGFQWNRFAATQIDRVASESTHSYDRFFAETGLNPDAYAGKRVLEVGSGAGRFTEVLLKNTEAYVHSVDFSNAVEANQKNNGANPRLRLAQASIYDLPFAPQQFDVVVCLGVLQHTPDVKRSVNCLCQMVKPGGILAIDFYPVNGWHTWLQAKYIFRPLTKHFNHDKLLGLITANAGWLISAYKLFNRLGVGRYVNRFLPICDIKNTLPKNLTPQQLQDWVILDTFDMFSPMYDQPQRISTMAGYVREAGIEVTYSGYVEYLKGLNAAVVRGKRN